MVNSIVIGPSASGKSTLCFKLVGMQCDTTHRPTIAVDYMQCTVNDIQFNVWDTPPCIENEVPVIAAGVLGDCDVAVVCYDGRREWSPVGIIETVGAHRAILALTDNRAYNWPTAKELYDLGSTALGSVPVVAADRGVDKLVKCILNMSTSYYG